ncbi:MAG: hypothetical protein KDB23_27200 [Planctomycetales bacterium]|nr:hypothetical protein [Planctomycetales bacterium]
MIRPLSIALLVACCLACHSVKAARILIDDFTSGDFRLSSADSTDMQVDLRIAQSGLSGVLGGGRKSFVGTTGRLPETLIELSNGSLRASSSGNPSEGFDVSYGTHYGIPDPVPLNLEVPSAGTFGIEVTFGSFDVAPKDVSLQLFDGAGDMDNVHFAAPARSKGPLSFFMDLSGTQLEEINDFRFTISSLKPPYEFSIDKIEFVPEPTSVLATIVSAILGSVHAARRRIIK